PIAAADTMLAAARLKTSAVLDYSGGTQRANQGKLPLWQHTIRGERGAIRCDTLHLFALFQARRVVGLLYTGAISSDLCTRKRRALSVGQPHRQTSFLRQLRLRHLFGIA